MLKYSPSQFDNWKTRILNDCKKVSGIEPCDLDFLFNYPVNIPVTVRGVTVVDPVPAVIYKNGYVISMNRSKLRIFNVTTGKSGYAKESLYEPSFNYETALAIAWARYCKNEIPIVKDFITEDNIQSIQNGTIIQDVYSDNRPEYIFIGNYPYDLNSIIVVPNYKTPTKPIIIKVYTPEFGNRYEILQSEIER